MNKLYCKYCGARLIRLPAFPPEYSEETGEPQEILECINNDCDIGKVNNCDRTGGCVYGFFSSRCKKCNRVLSTSRVR